MLRETTCFLITNPLLKTEGIFRINARALDLEILKEAYDRGQKFIVWREGETYQASTHRREGYGDVWVDEIEHAEGWGVFTATGLIKQWYRDLHEPLVPQASYAAIEKYYGNITESVEPAKLLSILSQDSDWSILPRLSRHILTMHLLPLLSRVAEFSDWNHMNARNLAVCFAPVLLCGPDPIRDLKISNILRSLLEAMVSNWKPQLARAFLMDHLEFEDSLRMPEAVEDREDPLQEVQMKCATAEAQTSGITLLDDTDSTEEPDDRPALPPRPGQSGEDMVTTDSTNGLRRKPVPPSHTPPRYSSVVSSRYTELEDGYTNNVPTADELDIPEDEAALPAYDASTDQGRASPPTPSTPTSIPRKPLPKTQHDS